MSVKKKRTIGPCRGVTWLYYVVFLWLRDFFPPLYLDPRFRPLLLKFTQGKERSLWHGAPQTELERTAPASCSGLHDL